MLNAFVMGSSHLRAVQAAFLKRPKDVGPRSIDMSFVLLNDAQFHPVLIENPQKPAELNPAILTKLQERSYDIHASLLGGNAHSILGLLNHPTPFDFVLPESPTIAVSQNCEIVPAGLLIAELSRRIAFPIRVLTLFRQLVKGPLIHLESPPPVPSEAHIRKYPGVFAEIIDERGVSPPLFRYKLWRLHSWLYKQACNDLGIHFLPVPEEMQDKHGMLIEAAWNPDPTHGSAVFGEAEIAKLINFAMNR